MLPGHYILFGICVVLFFLNRKEKKEAESRRKQFPRTYNMLPPCTEEEYYNQQKEKELLQTPELN
jgi:hypothetical protein